MALCELCKSIPFEDLPPFPEGDCTRTSSGLPHLQHIRYRGEQPFQSRCFKYHSDLESLRRTAAAGCGLCRQIEKQADAILDDIDGIPDRLGVYQCQPTFDLWLTKRLNGGDGFTVLTDSAWQTGKYIIPVAAIGFSADHDSALAASIKGRRIRESLDQTVLNWATEQLSENNKHQQCLYENKTSPPRLLDVGDLKSGEQLHVVEVATDTDRPYIALSHCRKTDDSIVPCGDGNLALSSLPKLFQDAVAFTRALHLRFLWIDEICISAQEKEHWGRDSTKYAEVFIHARLTLAATSSTATSDALFVHRKSRDYVALTRKGPSGTEDIFYACALPLDKEVLPENYLEMKSEPLSESLWAFQERVLSRRILHVCNDQLYFESLEGFASEDGLLIPRRYHSIYPSTNAEDETDPKETARYEWYNLLRTYGRRNAQNSTEKLAAMANIARVYANKIDDKYIAGLFERSLLEELCWQGLRSKGALTGQAPSWSWVSLNGMAATGFIAEVEPIATVIEFAADTVMQNSFGGMECASIDLQAPLIPLVLSDTKGPTGHMYLTAEAGTDATWYAGFDTLDKSYDVSAKAVKDLKLFALVLAASSGKVNKRFAGLDRDSVAKTYHSLIVTPVTNGSSSVRRLGFLLQGSDDLTPGQLSTTSAVKLV